MTLNSVDIMSPILGPILGQYLQHKVVGKINNMKYIIFLVYSRCLINIFILLQHIKFSLFAFFFF